MSNVEVEERTELGGRVDASSLALSGIDSPVSLSASTSLSCSGSTTTIAWPGMIDTALVMTAFSTSSTVDVATVDEDARRSDAERMRWSGEGARREGV